MKTERLCHSLAFGASMAGLTYVFYSAYLGRTGWDVVVFSGAMLFIALSLVWIAGRDPRANTDTILLLRSLRHSLMHPFTDYWVRRYYYWAAAHLRDLSVRLRGDRFLSVAKDDRCVLFCADHECGQKPVSGVSEAIVPKAGRMGRRLATRECPQRGRPCLSFGRIRRRGSDTLFSRPGQVGKER